MRILVTGTRGIPNIQGGVETHCEALYPLLIRKCAEIMLIRRSSYVNDSNRLSNYLGVMLKDIYSPRQKIIEAILHTFLAIVYAKWKGYGYIHIHAIGPSLVIPFARILGIKVIMTHHGPDYERQKWGVVAKLSLKLGEWCAARFANEIIVISNTINTILKKKYNRHDAHLIPNGATTLPKATSFDYIDSLGLKPQKYIIAVGRFVPEKGFRDLLSALPHINPDFTLVLVGDSDHPSTFCENLKHDASANGVVLTGFIKGEKLHQIFSHAALFVMPSYHEGLPIALLEALSYNLLTVVSDIPANLEVELSADHYFKTGDVSDLANKINSQLNEVTAIAPDISLLSEKYDWNKIADQTVEVYKLLMKK